MSYLQQLAQAGHGSTGMPPAGRNVGVPPLAPHVEPAPYDAAKDPSWKGLLSHGGEEFRNFVNGLDDGARQMLHNVLTSVQKMNPVPALQAINPLAQAAQAMVPGAQIPPPPPQGP